MTNSDIIPIKSHRVQFSLTAEHYEAIGALSAHFSLMEMFLGMAVWHFLKLAAYDGTLVTGSLSLKQRFDLLIELCKSRPVTPADIAEIKSIEIEFSKEDGITARRNRYIHAVWATDVSKQQAMPLNFNRQGKLRSSPHVTPDDIEAVTKDISVQAKRLQSLLRRCGYVPESGISFALPIPPPSPGKS